jgi:ubiquinone biosynthesis protein
VLDPNNISWEKQAIELRVSAQREVPVLTTPTRIPPVARLVVVVWVLSKALVPWFVKKKLRPFVAPEDSRAYISLRMRKAVERLGSTYIKLGQIISSGEGLFPAELVNEFKLCRDQVPAIPFELVKKTIESELG